MEMGNSAYANVGACEMEHGMEIHEVDTLQQDVTQGDDRKDRR